MLAVLQETFLSKNQMNIITVGKTPEPRWLDFQKAKESLKNGILTWDFLSDETPDLVLAGIGDYVTKEAIAALELVKKDAPEIKIRFVNIIRLQAACGCVGEFHPQIPNAEKYFTMDKPVIVNFHGYPEAMQSILFKLKNPQRFSVHGYVEEGGTTTPFDMHVRNKTDRYHLAIEIFEIMAKEGVIGQEKKHNLIAKHLMALDNHDSYIKNFGSDPQELENWQWAAHAPETVDRQDVTHGAILKNARAIAFVGLSDNPERHSHQIAKYFQAKGYRIIPINPNVTEVLGEKSYKNLLDVPKSIHIDIVDIFRKPEEVVAHMKEVVERGNIKTVWLAEGINTPEAEEFVQDYGLFMVTNFCIMDAYKEIEQTV